MLLAEGWTVLSVVTTIIFNTLKRLTYINAPWPAAGDTLLPSRPCALSPRDLTHTETQSIMNTPASRPWWPANPQSASALAVSLRDSGASMQLFEFCAVAIASQDWEIFAPAMATLCDVSVRSIRNMTGTAKFDGSWAILYGQTGMAPELFPLFTEILRVVRQFQPTAGEQPSGAQRLAVLQQAMGSPDLRLLKVPADLKAALLA